MGRADGTVAVLVSRHRFRLTALTLAIVSLLAGVFVCDVVQAYPENWSGDLRAAMAARFGSEGVKHLDAWQKAWQNELQNEVQKSAPTRTEAAVDDIPLLVSINAMGNRIPYRDDAANWGVEDYWATPAEFVAKDAGDCEDYVIAKYYSLRALGVPGSALRFVYARAFLAGRLVPHMVLAWYARPDAEPLLLDNLDGRLLPASQRPDLSPLFAFNEQSPPSTAGTVQGRPQVLYALSRWQDLQARVSAEARL